MLGILDVLDNREKAALVWIALVIAFSLRSEQIRSSFVSVFKTLLSRQLLTVLGAMIGYVSLTVFSLQLGGFWDLSLTKHTVVWFLGPAMLMVFNSGQAGGDAEYFKKILFTNLRLALVLEFLVSFYVFYLVFELLFAPIMAILAVLLVVSESKPELAQVKRFLEFLITAVGLFLLSYALAMLVRDAGSFLTGDTVRLFVLPVVLTVLFLPFIYALALYGRFERRQLSSRRRSMR